MKNAIKTNKKEEREVKCKDRGTMAGLWQFYVTDSTGNVRVSS